MSQTATAAPISNNKGSCEYTRTHEQWLVKHTPSAPTDIAGHARTIRTIREWLMQMSEQEHHEAPHPSTTTHHRPPPIMFLHGPGGVGKTSLARALLSHSNYRIYELNSSEVRSKKRIEEIMDKVLNNHSVSMMKKKGTRQTVGIIMDEIDGMSCGDRGGLHELFHIVQRQFEKGVVNNPIICISNKPYVKKLPECLYQEIAVRHPSECDIAQRLREVCDKEQVVVDDITLMWIVKYGQRDVRRTIHFLQEVVYYFGNVPGRELTIEDVDLVKQITAQTVADHNLFDVTRAVFSKSRPLDELHSMYQSDPHMTLVMMHENMHAQLQQKKVTPVQAAEVCPYTDVLHHLSLTSMFLAGNTHWELSHAMAAMCCGVVNERVGALPAKYSTTKKIQFTNTLTKGATYTSIMHSLSDASCRLRLHRSHYPRAIPLLLHHLVEHPERVDTCGLSLGELEKLAQVHSKWEGATAVTATAPSSSQQAGGATYNNSNSNSTSNSTPPPRKSTSTKKTKASKQTGGRSGSVSKHVSVQVTPRIKKIWKATLVQKSAGGLSA